MNFDQHMKLVEKVLVALCSNPEVIKQSMSNRVGSDIDVDYIIRNARRIVMAYDKEFPILD